MPWSTGAWDQETNLVSSLNLKEIGHWQTHFALLKPWCLIKTWEPRCKLLYNLAVSPMSTLTDLRWVTDGESFLKSFKNPFSGWIFAIFLICFVFTSLREVFETPGSRVVGDLLVTKLIFLTRCNCCNVMSAKKVLETTGVTTTDNWQYLIRGRSSRMWQW